MLRRLVALVMSSILMAGLVASTADAQAPFSYRRLVDFPNLFPASTSRLTGSTMARASDGTLYGTMTQHSGLINDSGVLFSMTVDGVYSVLHTFVSFTEGLPLGTPIQASDGNIYGVFASQDGVSGGLYKAGLDGTYQLLHAFGVSDGGRPKGELIEASNGRLYGVTLNAVFEITKDGTFRVLQVFDDLSRTGLNPATLVEGPNGDLIGTTGGTPFLGLIVGATVYRLTLTGVQTTLGYPGRPWSLIRAQDGSVFGTGILGANLEGGIYRIAPDGTYSVVATVTVVPFFHTISVPQVIEGTDGQLYAWSCTEGPGGHGQVLRVARDGSVAVLHTFTGDTDGGCVVQVFQAADGRVYGRTSSPAVVFTIDESGFAVIHTYSGTGGAAELLQALDGRLYGTVNTGGTFGTGGIYRLRPSEPGATSSSLLADFDGDHRSDRVVYGTTTGRWSVLLSSTQFNPAMAKQYDWGLAGDVPLVADFDADGKADLVVYRPTEGRWYIRFSSSDYSFADWTWYQWGLPGDVPMATDFDGDGRTDLVVYRPTEGRWYVRYSSSNYSYGNWTSYQWGLPGDVPLAADFDGDHRADLSVYRPSNGTWYVRFSSNNYSYATWTSYQWGLVGDVPLVTDFDGDGETDLAVWRPSTGTWYVRLSTSQYSYDTWRSIGWGLTDDVPLPGDFDGDHKTDATVWRPDTGTWYDLYSSSNYSYATWQSFVWGSGTDTPL